MILNFALAFSICLLLNIYIHGDILIAFLNILLLGLSLLFFQIFSKQKISKFNPIYIILLGFIPLFSHYPKDPIVAILAIFTTIFILLYLKTKLNFFLVLFFLGIFIGSLYAGEIIRFPFSFQKSELIFNKETDQIILEMQKQALFLPHSIRPLIFNPSVYFYVFLSKVFEVFTLKNLYDILLLANLYPLYQGIILDLKSFSRQRLFIYLAIFVTTFTIIFSRSVDNFDFFLLLSPFLIYFLLLGLKEVNKNVYLLLVILSLFMAISPLK